MLLHRLARPCLSWPLTRAYAASLDSGIPRSASASHDFIRLTTVAPGRCGIFVTRKLHVSICTAMASHMNLARMRQGMVDGWRARRAEEHAEYWRGM